MGGNEIIEAGLFVPWRGGVDCIRTLSGLVNLLRITFERSAASLDTEFIYQLHLALNRIATLVSELEEFSSIVAIKNLLLQVFGSATIPFSGEPLAGLQVMGLLETRCLDFKNVILVSANEGVLPAQSSPHSFVMYDLRRAFDLPVYQERDALSAYHFYRLMQRAENICIVYNTDQDTFGVKEKSRFVSQLMHELPKVNKQLSVKYLIAGAELGAEPMADEISISSSPEIVAIAKEKAAAGFSPSLINLFRECRLKFYFRYIAGLQEEREVEENVDQNTLGTIIHEALEKLYEPNIGKPLTPDIIAAMKKEVVSACKNAFKKLFPEEENEAGKNHLANKIAQRYIGQYLDGEKEWIKKQLGKGVTNTVVGLEQIIETHCEVEGTQVRFYGKADRIDHMNNIVRIIDYKTGLVEKKDVKVTDTSKFLETDKGGKSFQLLMYAWLYTASQNPDAVMQPGIVSFRKIKDGFLFLETPNGKVVTKNSLGDFEEVLMSITKQILSPETVFTQTASTSLCRNCEFNSICRR